LGLEPADNLDLEVNHVIDGWKELFELKPDVEENIASLRRNLKYICSHSKIAKGMRKGIAFKYYGPFKVVAVEENGCNYTIKREGKKTRSKRMHKKNIKPFYKRDLTTTSLITLHWDTGSQHLHPQRIFLTLSLSRVESSPAHSSRGEDDGDNIYIISEETYSLIKNVSYLLPPSCFIFFYLIFFYSCRSQIQCSPATLILK